ARAIKIRNPNLTATRTIADKRDPAVRSDSRILIPVRRRNHLCGRFRSRYRAPVNVGVPYPAHPGNPVALPRCHRHNLVALTLLYAFWTRWIGERKSPNPKDGTAPLARDEQAIPARGPRVAPDTGLD